MQCIKRGVLLCCSYHCGLESLQRSFVQSRHHISTGTPARTCAALRALLPFHLNQLPAPRLCSCPA